MSCFWLFCKRLKFDHRLASEPWLEWAGIALRRSEVRPSCRKNSR